MTEYITKHFTKDELSCRGSGEYSYEGGFIAELQELREECGFPFNITSGCRAADYNAAIGGHPNSLHLTWNPYYGVHACAIDMVLPSSEQLAILVELALEREFSVGLNKKHNFVHLDMRTRFTGRPPKLWVY